MLAVPPIGLSQVRIYDGLIDPGVDRTEINNDLRTTQGGGNFFGNTGNNGSGDAFNNQPAYVGMKFIIKT